MLRVRVAGFRALHLCLFAALCLGAACSLLRKDVAPREIHLIAVLPVEPLLVEPTPGTLPPPALPEEAGPTVTAHIYGVLADRHHFRFVPDLNALTAVQALAVRNAETLKARALAFGQATGADGVIFGTVSRFRERVGTQYGVTRPAAVSFELSLLDVKTNDVIWTGNFEKTQEPLSANLLDFWMFWRTRPRWFTAGELTRLGVEKLYEEMRRALGR